MGKKVILALLELSVLLSACGKPVYLAYVDKVEPEIPGLGVKEYSAVIGAFEIINNTGQDLYLYNQQGEESIKIASTGGVFVRDDKGQWKKSDNSNWINVSGPPVSYEGPPPKKRGTVVNEWVVRGCVGDIPFAIHGRTVYEPW